MPDYSREVEDAEAYLDEIARGLAGHVETGVWVGDVVHRLVELAETCGITHLVMASHGRTGLARVVLGSVADGLIHRLSYPIVVVPAPARGAIGDHDEVREGSLAPAT
jgi:nucleotide-binding universal stress UspA family protein